MTLLKHINFLLAVCAATVCTVWVLNVNVSNALWLPALLFDGAAWYWLFRARDAL